MPSDPCPNPRAPFAALALASLLGACTTVRIEAGPDDVRIERHFGLLGVRLASPHRSLVAEMSGFGVLSAPGSLSLGYASLRFASLGPDCRVVLWLAPGERLPLETLDRLRQVAGVCFTPPQP
jgi:hypothetical protein